MKKFVFLIALCVFYSCSKGSSHEEFKVEYEAKLENIEKKNEKGEYKISYPYFKDYPELNKIVEKRIEDEKKFINGSQDLLEYYISFGEVRTSGKYIGFMFSMASYFLGAAHPTTQICSINYDTVAKKEVFLKDVFAPLSNDYINIFSDFTYKELNSRLEKEELASSSDFIKNGTMPEERNFACFNLKGSEVIVLFNQYQVAPYSSGISEVSIPLNIFK